MSRRSGAGSRRATVPLTREAAMDVAFRLLAARGRSEAEIAGALVERGASASLARRVVSRLRALGYLDDGKLAREVLERWRDRGYGSLRIQAELRRLQVGDAVVEGTALDAREERDAARRTLAGRFSGGDLADRRVLARAARFLAGRGFASDVIESLLERFAD